MRRLLLTLYVGCICMLAYGAPSLLLRRRRDVSEVEESNTEVTTESGQHRHQGPKLTDLLRPRTNLSKTLTVSNTTNSTSPEKGENGGSKAPKVDIGIGGNNGTTNSSGLAKSKPKEAGESKLRKEIDEKMELYHQIKKKIQFLQEHLKKHEDFNLIPGMEMEQAGQSLEDIQMRIIHPLEKTLLFLRQEILGAEHNLSEDEKNYIYKLLDYSTKFLTVAKEKLDKLTRVEQEWTIEEESAQLTKRMEDELGGKSQPEMAANNSITDGADSTNTSTTKPDQISADVHPNDINSTVNATEAVQVHSENNIKNNTEAAKENITKRIKDAMKKAADKSHEFMDKALNHRHTNGTKTTTYENDPSRYIAVIFVIIACAFIAILLIIIAVCKHKRTREKSKNEYFGFRSNSPGKLELKSYTGFENPINNANRGTPNSNKLNNLLYNPSSCETWTETWTTWETSSKPQPRSKGMKQMQ